MDMADLLILIPLAVVGIPFVAYATAKMVTYGYLKARKDFRERNRRDK